MANETSLWSDYFNARLATAAARIRVRILQLRHAELSAKTMLILEIPDERRTFSLGDG